MFLLEFRARRITFCREQLIDPVVQLAEQITIDRVWQDDMTEFIELFEKIAHSINRYGYWFRSVSWHENSPASQNYCPRTFIRRE